MTTIILALLAFAASPPELALVDQVDIIELNHLHDARGHRTFSQWIFWRWNHDCRRYEVAAWRMAKHPSTWSRGTLRIVDGNHIREIRTVSYRETWTRYDPEVVDREFTAPESRQGLARPKVSRAHNLQQPLHFAD